MIEYKCKTNDLPNKNFKIKIDQIEKDNIIISLPDFLIRIDTTKKEFHVFDYEG